MVTMICWLVIHTSNDGLDNRRYEQFKGAILEEGMEIDKINFTASFAKKHVNIDFNNPIQWVSDEECLYDTK